MIRPVLPPASSGFRRPSQLALWWSDLRQSIGNWPFWVHLGWEDVVKQYRRSFLGPIWITLSTALFVVAFGLMGAQIFKIDVRDYLPYFCAGLVLFQFISGLLTEGCHTYIAAEAFLKQTRAPKLAFALRVVFRNWVMLLHHLPVVLGVLLWSGHIGQIHWLALVLGLLMTLLWVCMLVAVLGVVCVRYRDVPLIVSSVIQVAFFITPVMWKPEQLTASAQRLVDFNPLAAFLDILRAPLLGQSASGTSWWVVVITCGVSLIVFVAVTVAARRRIVYWV